MASDQPGEEQARGPIRSEPGSLLEQVAVAVFGIDEAGRVCYWGPGAQGLFGHAAPDILTHPAARLFPTTPADLDASRAAPDASLDPNASPAPATPSARATPATPDAFPAPATPSAPAASAGPDVSEGPRTAADAAARVGGDGGPAERLAERARALGYWRVRLPVLHRDGSVFDCGFRVFPVTGAPGAPGGSVVIGLASRGDELDRVKTNLAFLDALFENCPIGLVMLDEDLRYVHLNQVLADMDGMSVPDHLGRGAAEVMITSDDGEFEGMLRAVADHGTPWPASWWACAPRAARTATRCAPSASSRSPARSAAAPV